METSVVAVGQQKHTASGKLQQHLIKLVFTQPFVCCRGAGPMQLVSGNGCRLLQALLDLHLANSQDSSIRAAMLQLIKQLLAPNTLQQLLASGGSLAEPHTEAATAASGSGSGQDCKSAEQQPAADDPTSRKAADGGSDGTSLARGLLAQLLTQLLEGTVAESAGCRDAAAGGDTAAVNQHEWLATALEQLRITQPLQ
jgi:hypothetical protein